jgi:hypothetical protein
MKNKTPDKEDALKKMLQQSGLESPSVDFTASVMKLVAPESAAALTAQPVFSRKQILFFVLLFTALLLYALISGSTFSLDKKFNLDGVSAGLAHAVQTIASPMLLVVLLSGWTLYILDKVIRQNVLRH